MRAKLVFLWRNKLVFLCIGLIVLNSWSLSEAISGQSVWQASCAMIGMVTALIAGFCAVYRADE